MMFDQVKWIALLLLLSPLYGWVTSSHAVNDTNNANNTNTGNYQVTAPNPTINSNGTSQQASTPQNAPTPVSKKLKNKGVTTAYGFVRPTSTDAIRKYQTEHGLNPTGAMDADTTEALNNEQGKTHDNSTNSQ